MTAVQDMQGAHAQSRRPGGHTLALLVFLLCLLPLAGCGDSPPPVASKKSKQERGARAPSAERIDAALKKLESADAETRRGAIALLLRGAHTPRELTHLALRAVKHGRDVGLLADLLAGRPTETLPHVLHRVTHAASMHRGGLCRALGRRRHRTDAALAVLLVRALLDVDALVRLEARTALAALDPEALRHVRFPSWVDSSSGEGPALAPTVSLLLGLGNETAGSPLRPFLDTALKAEVERFGYETSPGVEAAQERPVRGVSAFLAGLTSPLDSDRSAERLALRMAREHREGTLSLGTLVQRPGYLRRAMLAYGMLGPAGASDSSILLALAREHLRSSPLQSSRVPGAPSQLEGESDAQDSNGTPEVEGAVDGPSSGGNGTSAAIAWALASVGDRSQETFNTLWELLRLSPAGQDHDTILAATQVLRPQGPFTDSLLQALVRRPNHSASAAVDARALLPMCADTSCERALQSLLELALQSDTPRPVRLAVRAVIGELGRSSEEREARAARLLEVLRQRALRTLPPSAVSERLQVALARLEDQTEVVLDLVLALIRDGDHDSPLYWSALLALPEADRIRAAQLVKRLSSDEAGR